MTKKGNRVLYATDEEVNAILEKNLKKDKSLLEKLSKL